MNTRGAAEVNWHEWSEKGVRGQGTQGVAIGNASHPFAFDHER